MAKEIWNEGRVVGYSAYDIYVKQHLANSDPDIPPASEVEWLSASLAMGNSMLLKIPDSTSDITEDKHYTIDIPLPSNSRLGAANTIIANFFDGDADFSNGSPWASKITSYGNLILNNSTNSPVTPGESANVPKNIQNDPSTWSDTLKAKLVDYMKIVDGVVIQPGEWYEIPNAEIAPNSSKPPQKDEKQDLRQIPYVRLRIKGKLGKTSERGDLLILLTGFTMRSILSGVSNINTSTSPELRLDENGDYIGRTAPEDGDFLGPAAYPWANKIIFSVPSSYIAYFMSDKYKRRIPSDTDSKSIKDTAVIDMNKGKNDGTYPDNITTAKGTAIDPHWFYTQARQGRLLKLPDYTNCEVPYTVDDFSTLGDGTSVLTVYEKKSIYPPALYGTFVQNRGEDYLTPLDCVAPGSVKMFIDDDGSVMKDYEDSFPGTVSMNKDSGTGEISTIIDIDGQPTKVPVASVDSENFEGAKAVKIKVGDKTVKAIAASPSVGTNNSNPALYPVTGAGGTIVPDNAKFRWKHLLDALGQNKSIDILQKGLKADAPIHITANADGTYTIIANGPEMAELVLENIIFKEGDGISINVDGNTIKITNTKPYDPAGIKYKYMDKSSGLFQVNLRGTFTGVKYGSPSVGRRHPKKTNGTNYNSSWGYNLQGWLCHYNKSNTKAIFAPTIREMVGSTRVDDSEEFTDLMKLGINIDNLVLDPATGKYKGTIYFKLPFSATSANGKVTYKLGNVNFSQDNFMLKHSSSTNDRIKKSTICTLKFLTSAWGNINSRTSNIWTAVGQSLWNISEAWFDSNKKVHNSKTGGSFSATIRMYDPRYDQFANHTAWSLCALSYADGYNSQLDRWIKHDKVDGCKEPILISKWLNMSVEFAVEVSGVDKAVLAAAANIDFDPKDDDDEDGKDDETSDNSDE